MALLPPLRFTGASVLRDGELQDRSLAIEHGRISLGPLPEIDLSGYLILPGIIDLHGDAFERHIAPRPTAPFPIAAGLHSTDREAAAHGVTTAWLAQSWSWEGGQRGPDFAEQLLQGLAAYRPRALVDLRVQIRCETHTLDSRDRLIAAIERYGVEYVVFNDHLTEALQTAKHAPQKLASWAAREGRSVESFQALLTQIAARADEVPRHLCRLAEAFDRMQVTYGSHDDPDGETREHYRLIGARIAEFPTAQAPAAVAKAMNDPVIMGAPNVVRGGSQSGNISARSLIAAGLCDILVSDYHYPTLAEAAWRLADEGLKTLPQAWAMISTVPAQVMGLADRGVLEPGRRADLVLVNARTRVIEATISGGRLAFLSGEAGARIAGAATAMPLAAE